jgi:hypothetical protein
MSDATGLAEAMLGLDGFLVLEVHESTDAMGLFAPTRGAVFSRDPPIGIHP